MLETIIAKIEEFGGKYLDCLPIWIWNAQHAADIEHSNDIKEAVKNFFKLNPNMNKIGVFINKNKYYNFGTLFFNMDDIKEVPETNTYAVIFKKE